MAQPTTAELVAAFAEAPKLNPGDKERELVDAVRKVVAEILPGFTPRQRGEVLMHFVPVFNALADRIHETDPMLDWESIAAVASNVIGVAGMEIYTAALAAYAPTDCADCGNRPASLAHATRCLSAASAPTTTSNGGD